MEANPPRLVMLVGCPRSGTTWLQSLLGSHPLVATSQETDLFTRYLQPLYESWQVQMRSLHDPGPRRRKGLPTVLTAEEFDAMGRGIVDSVIRTIAGMKPGASVVLEKSPSHALCSDVIRHFWPETTFIHLIRDGRDCAASIVAASGTWGQTWADRSVHSAARTWVDYVLGARRASDAPGGYLEVRYEDLRSDDGALLQRVFSACGLSVDSDGCAGLLERHRFDRASESTGLSESILVGGEAADLSDARTEPSGFVRRGVVGGWRDEWTSRERQSFDSVAGMLLVDLGYEPDDSWVGVAGGRSAGQRLRSSALSATARVLRSVAARTKRLADRAGSASRP